jgi:hypothetical protein
MPSDQIIFAGLEFSSGRKPIMFAALDGDLGIVILEKWKISEAFTELGEHENIWLAINVPSRRPEIYNDFKEKAIQMGFKLYSKESDSKQLLETSAQDCFRALIGQNLLPRRTLEGRIQRALILYERGLQMDDPMDVFEEITRFKLMQGILPLEHLYSSKELDALITAHLAWMAVNRPQKILVKDGFVLPQSEQSFPADENLPEAQDG